MKTLLFAILFTMTAQSALACPGGHLKTLKSGQTVIGEVDMKANQVRITADNAELLSIHATLPPKDLSQVLCGSESAGAAHMCDTTGQTLNNLRGGLRGNPEAILSINVKVGSKEMLFNVTDFFVTRSMRCGAEIQPVN